VVTITLPDEDATLGFGRHLSSFLKAGGMVCLEGDLGAGKTTLCRGILKGLGFIGHVRSPTFTLVEPYEIGCLQIFHIDLYRLADAQELEYLGIDDYFSKGSLSLVEWPENGMGCLPPHDLWIRLELVPAGRLLTCSYHSPLGEEIFSKIGPEFQQQESRD
jgi:tRNA threonylcarbamoyladenosine biosynthesis protein TsaE